MKIRYYIDSETALPHIYNHNISMDEVEDILIRPGEDRVGKESSRVVIGQTKAGRYLRIIYVTDPDADSIFVITAVELTGKPLIAYKRRQRKKK